MNVRTTIALLLGVALATAIGWFVYSLDTPMSDPDVVRVDGGDAPAGQVRSVGEGQEAGEVPTAMPDARFGVTTNDPSVATSTEAELVAVTIVRADTQAPVPAAAVCWWPRPMTLPGHPGFEARVHDSEIESMAASAVQLRSDGNGRVFVPDVAQGFVITAQRERLWGYASFDAMRSGQPMVVLEVDANLRVKVVDQDGRPVEGVRVALQERRLDGAIVHRTARTAADGLATLRHLARFLPGSSAGDTGLSVGVLGLFDPPLERRLVGDPGQVPVQFVLGPSGSCEVRVVDGSGQALALPLEARLGFADVRARLPAHAPDARGQALQSRTGGSLLFERVALGRTLHVEVTREGSAEVLVASGPGPARPGERVALNVIAGGASAILRGRVVEGSGAPAAEMMVRARLTAVEESGSAPCVLRTGTDGRFVVEVEARDGAPVAGEIVVARLGPGGEELATAQRQLPPLSAGTHELGDFTLVETQIVAAGRVVDAQGEPVPHATVTPSTAVDNDEHPSSLPDWLTPTRSDADGRFEIRGAAAPRRISLLADKSGLIGEVVEVAAHTRDATLVLGPAAAIEGVVLFDPSLHASQLMVQASPESTAMGRRQASGGATCPVGLDGSFTLGGLPSGAYSLRILYAATATLLAEVDNVRVEAGDRTREPRLDPLDLRASCQCITLEACDEQGRLVAHSRVASRASGVADAPWTFGVRDAGRLLVLSTGKPLDVAIAAPGFRHTELERVAASQRVVLQRAAKLRVTLTSGLPELKPPLRLGVKLTPRRSGRFPGFVESTTAFFTGGSALTCETAFVGEMGLELFVAGPESRIAPVGEATTIHVADHGSEQVFWLALEPERLAAAVRSLSEDR